jgi:hypothetical protein
MNLPPHRADVVPTWQHVSPLDLENEPEIFPKQILYFWKITCCGANRAFVSQALQTSSLILDITNGQWWDECWMK